MKLLSIIRMCLSLFDEVSSVKLLGCTDNPMLGPASEVIAFSPTVTLRVSFAPMTQNIIKFLAHA